MAKTESDRQVDIEVDRLLPGDLLSEDEKPLVAIKPSLWIIAFLSFLFHPDAGSFSIMMNGEPVGDDPLVRMAVIPAFLLTMLITGVLMTLVFLGVGAFLLIAAIFIAFAVL